MFDNTAQELFFTGAAGTFFLVPILNLLTSIFMLVSTYKLLKAREDKYKPIWLIAIFLSPILARIVYEIYRRCISKSDISAPKSNRIFLVLSLITFVLSSIMSAASILSMGAGYIQSELDGTPLTVYYDKKGNKYDDLYQVPLYDKEGNRYTYEEGWFTTGTYTDQEGNSYSGDISFLSEDGYFYYDADDSLTPYQNSDEYYTDGTTIYYYIFGRIYWDENGTIWNVSGRVLTELFDFDQ